MDETEKPSFRQVLRAIAIFIALAVSFFFLAVFFVPTDMPDIQGVCVLTVLTLLWCYPVILVHELGHYLGAKINRFKVLWLTVGQWTINFQDTKPRLKFNPIPSHRALGHVMSFPQDERNLKMRYLAVYAAGPCAHFIVAALALLAMAIANHTANVNAQYISRAAFIASGWLFLLGLFPLPGTDFAKVLELIFSRTLSRVAALSTIAGLSLNGVRPRDWSIPLLSILATAKDKSQQNASCLILQYYHALDNHDFSAAREYIVRAKSCNLSDNKTLWNVVTRELAYILAVLGDSVEAQAILAEIENSVPEHQLYRAKAAVAYANGEFAGAASFAQRALERHTEYKERGWATAEKELLSQYLSHET